MSTVTIRARRASVRFGFSLLACTLLAYWPAIGNGFVWDDDQYVFRNPTLTEPGGLRRIWLDPQATPQYYPLTFSSFYVEHRLWGFQPAGYHLDNVLLHAANAVLFGLILRRLGVPGGWLAAALFALHPVHVESVAWVTERKNTLSGLLALGALGAYLRFQPLDQGAGPASPHGGCRGWVWYGVSLALFALALLSKSVVASTAPVLVLLLWWKKPDLRRRDLYPLVPFFVLGAVLGLNNARLEVEHVGARGLDFALTPFDRALVAGRALWFYAGKLLAPFGLSFIYSRWPLDPRQAGQWVPVLAAIAVPAALFLARGRLGKGPLVAVLCYAVMLFPVLGFLNVYPMRFSFVADHFQYHASLALLALIAAAAAQRFPDPERRPRLRAVAALPVLILLGSLTSSRCLVFRDAMTLWTDTLAKNPSAWIVHTNLGDLLESQGRRREAIDHYRRAVELRPDHISVYLNLGRAYFEAGDLPRAIATYERGLLCRKHHQGASETLRRAAVENNLGTALVKLGDVSGSIAHFRQAIAEHPTYAEAHSNLGMALALLGRSDQAREHLRIALRLNPRDAETRAFLDRLEATGDRRGEPR
jgi:tetratricopeptide (TPR) repeat protein